MATLYQAKKLNELSAKGWKTIGCFSQGIGGPILMEDTQGNKFVAESDGTVRPTTAEDKPIDVSLEDVW